MSLTEKCSGWRDFLEEYPGSVDQSEVQVSLRAFRMQGRGCSLEVGLEVKMYLYSRDP